MNERIKELAEQAGAWDYYDIDDSFDCKMLHKLAELIVEECMNATRGASTGLDAFNNIKEHFGVE